MPIAITFPVFDPEASLPPPRPGDRLPGRRPPSSRAPRSTPPVPGTPSVPGPPPASGPPSPTVAPPAEGPPPPPAPAGSAGESRATAATWVAATGALLLLAAAATFLAVSWDTLGLTTRVAVVGAATGAAVLGGHRLRSVLPAVGAVVYHLGALLLPIDALGLALQIDASVAGRWLAVGVVAMVALPPLAAVGASRVLAWTAIAGIPVAATGVGLLGLAPASVVVVVAAVVAVVAAGALGAGAPGAGPLGRGPLGAVVRTAAPVLAIVAVHVPLIVASSSAVPGSGGALDQAAAAGWLPSAFLPAIAIGAVAVAVLAVAATRQRSTGIAVMAPVTAGVAVVSALLPAGTPRMALFVGPAVLAVVLEVAAIAGRRNPLWAAPTVAAAVVAEVLGAMLVLQVMVVAVFPAVLPAADLDVAVALAVVAVAWIAAAGRRYVVDGLDAPLVPVGIGLAALHVAAAVAVGGGEIWVSALSLVLGALITMVWRATSRPTVAHVAVTVAVALLGLAAIAAAGRLAALVVVAAVPLVVGTHLRGAIRSERAGAAGVLALVVPAAVVILVGSASGLTAVAGLPSGTDAVVALLGLLLFATTLDGRPGAADAVRGLALTIGLIALVPAWPAGGVRAAGNIEGLRTVLALGLLPAALVPATLVASWLAVDALRLRRRVLAVLVVPAALRAMVSGLLAVGLSITATAAVVLAVGVVAGGIAAAGPARLRAMTVTAAAIALPVGYLLIGDDPWLRASLLLAIGLVGVAIGSIRRLPPVAHIGGVIATLGVWDLFGLADVTTVDVWVLPVGLHLAVAGALARRRRGTSSWVADVPAVLLVVIPAIAERIAGGSGWHAVLAGGVALVAVVAGGVWRLAGPLVMGTVLLVVVVLVETFAVVAAVPTWVWLAVGGAVLLGAAALIERTGSPARAARRLVEVVEERFV